MGSLFILNRYNTPNLAMERYISKAQSIAQSARVVGQQVGSQTADKLKEIVLPGYAYDNATDEKASEIKQCLDSKVGLVRYTTYEHLTLNWRINTI